MNRCAEQLQDRMAGEEPAGLSHRGRSLRKAQGPGTAWRGAAKELQPRAELLEMVWSPQDLNKLQRLQGMVLTVETIRLQP